MPPEVWAAADEVFRAALELGGTLTGEHGVGMIKRRWLGDELSPESMMVHHAIKNALDPGGIMNPARSSDLVAGQRAHRGGQVGAPACGWLVLTWLRSASFNERVRDQVTWRSGRSGAPAWMT